MRLTLPTPPEANRHPSMFPFQSAISRRIIVTIAVLGGVWWLNSKVSTPLRLRAEDSSRQLGELQDKARAGRKTLDQIEAAGQKAEEAGTALNRLLSNETAHSMTVSFPDKTKRHFTRLGYPSAVVRLNVIKDEPDLPGCQRIYWSVGLPLPETGRGAPGLLDAVVEFEEQNQMIKVLDFVLQPHPEDPRQRMAGFNVVALIRK